MSEIAATLGIVSDTHGHLPGAALHALEGVDRIVHCGDIGEGGVLEELALVAPVWAVAGNLDAPSRQAPLRRIELFGGVTLAITHGHLASGGDYPPALCRFFAGDDAAAPPPRLICYGHTHRYREEWVGPTLTLNPGALRRPRDGAAGLAIVTFDGRGGLLVRRVKLSAG